MLEGRRPKLLTAVEGKLLGFVCLNQYSLSLADVAVEPSFCVLTRTLYRKEAIRERMEALLDFFDPTESQHLSASAKPNGQEPLPPSLPPEVNISNEFTPSK